MALTIKINLKRESLWKSDKVMKPEDVKKNTGQLWKNQYIISVGTALLQNSEKWAMIRQNCR